MHIRPPRSDPRCSRLVRRIGVGRCVWRRVGRQRRVRDQPGRLGGEQVHAEDVRAAGLHVRAQLGRMRQRDPVRLLHPAARTAGAAVTAKSATRRSLRTGARNANRRRARTSRRRRAASRAMGAAVSRRTAARARRRSSVEAVVRARAVRAVGPTVGRPPCTPKTCADYPGTCGAQSDGCGNLTPDCGGCVSPLFCGGSATPGVCGGNDGFGPRRRRPHSAVRAQDLRRARQPLPVAWRATAAAG